MSIARILVIAGSDSGGGAGVQADIKTITMLGGHAMTAITAITAQNTQGVLDVLPVPVEMIMAQIDAVADDIGVDAVKIGMIGSPVAALAVADRLERMPDVPIVFDPVMVATSGAVLADAETVRAFDRLMKAALLVTPNTPELEALTSRKLADLHDAEAAARDLADRTGAAILAKGGHLGGEGVADILVEPGGHVTRFQGARIDTTSTHGTGCTLASAIACGLGQDLPLHTAIERARAYTLGALEAAPGLGNGHGPIGHALGKAAFS